MFTQIRLAHRQGLLARFHVSDAQAKANFLLDAVERIEYNNSQRRQMQRDVGTMGWERFAQVFPEDVPPTLRPSTEEELDEVMTDGGPVLYQSPSQSISEDEMEKLLDQLISDSSSGTVSGSDLGGP